MLAFHFLFFKRLHTALEKIEEAKKCDRWPSTNTKFIAIADGLEIAEKDRLLRHLHQNASERAFLVSLLSKYCGSCSNFVNDFVQLIKTFI